MPRRHPNTYRRPKSSDDALADIDASRPGRATGHDAPHRELPPIDYRPVVAVIAIVIFRLGLIAFLLSLSAK